MDDKPKGVKVQYRIILKLGHEPEFPWLVHLADHDGTVFKILKFETKHAAEDCMDTYSFILSRLQVDILQGL